MRHVKFYPYEQGLLVEKNLSHAKGEYNKIWGSFVVVA